MEVMGFRNGVRAGTELCALEYTDSMAAFIGKSGPDGEGLKAVL